MPAKAGVTGGQYRVLRAGSRRHARTEARIEAGTGSEVQARVPW